MMRLSVDKDDPGYVQWNTNRALGKHETIYLDGIEQRLVRMADEETGEIERLVPDASGLAQIDPKNPDDVWYEIVRGKVEIKFLKYMVA